MVKHSNARPHPDKTGIFKDGVNQGSLEPNQQKFIEKGTKNEEVMK